MSNWLKPFEVGNALIIEMSDQMIACGDDGRLKQLDTRLSKFSGFMDLGFTVGYSFFAKDAMYDSLQGVMDFGEHVDCTTYGKHLGVAILFLVN